MTASRTSQDKAMKPHEKIIDRGLLLARKRLSFCRSIPLHPLKEALRGYLLLSAVFWSRASAGLYSALV